MIVIHAMIKVNPQHRAAFIEQAGRVTEQSRAEEGNIGYRIFEEVDQPNVFLVLEHWADQAAVESHKSSAHFNEFIQGTKEYLIEPLDIDVIPVPDSAI